MEAFRTWESQRGRCTDEEALGTKDSNPTVDAPDQSIHIAT